MPLVINYLYIIYCDDNSTNINKLKITSHLNSLHTHTIKPTTYDIGNPGICSSLPNSPYLLSDRQNSLDPSFSSFLYIIKLVLVLKKAGREAIVN
jgi:hypothetical protein